jgi:AAA+ superfamily predicted ATPase
MERTLGPNITWETCEPAEIRALLAELRTRGPQSFGSAAVLRAQRARLPFYEDHELFDLVLHGVPGVERAVLLRSQSHTQWLDGQSAPIHAVNALEALELTEATVLDYARLFLYAMRADQGAFVLIEHPEELTIATPTGKAPADELATQLANARAQWASLRLDGRTDDGRFRVRATVAYGGGLYASAFAVKPDGEIEMIDDQPLSSLDGLATPACPELKREPEDTAPPAPRATSAIEQAVEAIESAERRAADQAREAHAKSDLPVTEAFVSVLLAEAVRGALGHRLLQRFNTQSHPAGSLGQLVRFITEFAPVVVIESAIPFVEDIVVGLLDPEQETFPKSTVRHAAAVSGDDSRCWVDTREAGAKLHMISFHAYRLLWDADWTAHQLAIGDAAVLIGCERRADVPEPLRRVTDLFLTLPRIDERLFVAIFRRIMGVPPPPRWRAGGADWVRYLLHTDFHAPLRLSLDAAEAIAYLRERSQARLALVSAIDSPALKDLHGLGEARQVAEDLIADVAAARAGRISWQAVDRGLLLVGAPGTGKTTLARAIAQACDIKFVHASAAQWQSAGGLDQHLRAMRTTFAEARRYAPAILFIDEIDSIGNRETFEGSNAIYQTEVVNGLLEQIQGMDAQEPLIVIGATNFLEKVDPALRRAGRLDQVINVPRPNVAGLEQIFAYYLAPQRKAKNLERDIKVKSLAQLAFGLTGADVEFFVRGAARRARKEGRRICQADLIAEVTRRPRRPDAVARLSPEDMRRVAVHEAGHALSALSSTAGAPELAFVTIIPRMDGSLGFTASVPPDGGVMTRTQVLERMRTILGGRAAEEVVYGKRDISLNSGGGPSSDLAVATRTATSVVCTSGFGTDGSLHWTTTPTAAQARQIDALLRSAYRAAVELLRANRDALDRVVDALMESQELDGDAVRALWQKPHRAPRRRSAEPADLRSKRR